MAEWWLSPPPPPPLSYGERLTFDYRPEKHQPLLPPQAQHSLPPLQLPAMPPPPMHYMPPPKVDNPRELRNKAEKQRRDKLNHSIAELSSLVPPVVFSTRKIDKTGVLRYTAHYLRAHQYVFDQPPESVQFTQSSTQALLSLLNGFLLTTTYKGLIVVVSQNINEYLGYTELELLGKSVFGLVHEDDRELLLNQLLPRSQVMGKYGELLLPSDEEGKRKVAEALSNENRRFIVRFLKLGQRSEPGQYVTCHVEGSFRMSDRAVRGSRCCQMVRRARARGDNPCSSGNDVVFIGVVRPCTETFINESALETYRMEYRTRHSIDGEIIQCEQRIALVTGYMMMEVSGVNAMNFIHRDEVRWVIIALKEMYNQSQVFGESCYRLMTKNGQFIYMRTRGRLDVDSSSRAVTSFVCTNTVVDEKEGKHLIRMMKERFMIQGNRGGQLSIEDADTSDSQAVEDPRQLEKAILNMVTTLPSVDEDSNSQESPARGDSPRLALIPPKKERIVSAIEKIYTVIKTIPKSPSEEEEQECTNEEEQSACNEDVTPNEDEENNEVFSLSLAESPKYPSFEYLFQAQSSFDDSESYSPVTTTDFVDFDSAMINSVQEMLPDDLNDIDSAQLESEHVTLPPANESNANPLPSFSHLTAGVKRPSSENVLGEASNKKPAMVDNSSNEQPSTSNNQLLETFSDEEDLMKHIQSAIESIDNVDQAGSLNLDYLDETQPIDFSDFLTPAEVEEFFGTEQNDSEGEN